MESGFLTQLGLVISEPEQVLICTHSTCRYALQVHDKRVSRHLWEKHQIPKGQRHGLDRLVASLNLRDPRTVNVRASGSAPYPHLEVLDGYRCRQCGNLTTSSKLSQNHPCFPNERSPSQEQDRASTASEEAYLQCWVREGARQYWVVRPISSPSTDTSSPNEAAHNEKSRLKQVC